MSPHQGTKLKKNETRISAVFENEKRKVYCASEMFSFVSTFIYSQDIGQSSFP